MSAIYTIVKTFAKLRRASFFVVFYCKRNKKHYWLHALHFTGFMASKFCSKVFEFVELKDQDEEPVSLVKQQDQHIYQEITGKTVRQGATYEPAKKKCGNNDMEDYCKVTESANTDRGVSSNNKSGGRRKFLNAAEKHLLFW